MYEFTIRGISGGSEKHAIVDAVRSLDRHAQLDFNWVTSKVRVDSSADLSEIRDMLTAIGFQIEAIAESLDAAERTEAAKRAAQGQPSSSPEPRPRRKD